MSEIMFVNKTELRINVIFINIFTFFFFLQNLNVNAKKEKKRKSQIKWGHRADKAKSSIHVVHMIRAIKC